MRHEQTFQCVNSCKQILQDVFTCLWSSDSPSLRFLVCRALMSCSSWKKYIQRGLTPLLQMLVKNKISTHLNKKTSPSWTPLLAWWQSPLRCSPQLRRWHRDLHPLLPFLSASLGALRRTRDRWGRQDASAPTSSDSWNTRDEKSPVSAMYFDLVDQRTVLKARFYKTIRRECETSLIKATSQKQHHQILRWKTFKISNKLIKSVNGR